MPPLSLTQWIEHLRSIAEPVAISTGKLGAGELDAPFRAAACGECVPLPDEPVQRGEIGLWWALTDERVDIDAIISTPTNGSILPQNMFRAIEVWTDADLSALHALWWLAAKHDRPDWFARIEKARNWHIANTQPDNATNRPWALHVFLLAGSAECNHYAQTLLHNCLTMNGRPDPLSAFILLDAARAIECASV